ncbi:hypothetical protein FPV67DRAFT_891469 [Lyophyllum atratum]|nr:hypothetical protein FPV67DRAFT_891469 [Lyophyllum atratum]
MSNHTLLEETAKHIETLERRKSELVQEVHQVEKELGDAHARHAKLVNLTAPVSKLPDEILADIFQLCQKTRVKIGAARIAFAVAGSHVSTRWRGVMLGTPLLWNTIDLTITHRTRTRALQRLLAHLTRSGHCLLDLSLHIDVWGNIPVLLYHLTPHADRWYRVSISVTRGSADDLYAPFCSVAAPSLIHLSLRIGNPEDDTAVNSPRTEYPDTCPPIITRGSPMLKFVRVAGKVVGNLVPPLNAVTTFHVDAWPKNLMSLAQFRALIDALPNVVNLSLTGLSIHLPRSPLDISEPISLPTLLSLRIRGNSTPSHRLLSLLALPNLEALSLHGVDTFDSAVIPTLQHLTLDSCIFSEGELQNVFKAFPCVSVLSIDESTPEIISMLHVIVGSSPLWPQLRSIFMKRLPPADVISFCFLVLHRANNNTPLSSVHLDKRSRSVLRTKDLLQVLGEQVLVEDCDYQVQWPADLGYEDPDDGWDY